MHKLLQKYCMPLSEIDFKLICSMHNLDKYHRINWHDFLKSYDPYLQAYRDLSESPPRKYYKSQSVGAFCGF